MSRLPRPFVCCTVTTAAAVLAAGTAATAESTSFNSTLTALSQSAFQVNEEFSLLFDLDTAYVDFNLDNVPDGDVPLGGGLYLGEYLDPQYYILDFALPGTGTELRPYYLGSELTAADTVDWRLSYALTPGDTSTLYSTIMSGSAESISGGLTLNIDGGFEWPVNGWGIPDVPGLPLGTHWAAALADFDSMTFNYPGQSGPASLVANVIPAPGALALMGLGGLASRRRRH